MEAIKNENWVDKKNKEMEAIKNENWVDKKNKEVDEITVVIRKLPIGELIKHAFLDENWIETPKPFGRFELCWESF